MKETIVLIHGYGFDQSIWSPVELAFNDFHVVRLSLPGFGDAPAEEPYSINTLAQRFWMDLKSESDAPVHLVGHSMGGYVCIEMAAQQPNRVASLALIHSHVFADTPAKQEARTQTMELIKAGGRDAFVRKMISSFFQDVEPEKTIAERLITRGLSHDDHAWYFGMEAMRDRQDHGETLKSLKVPVLMLMGAKDGAVPVELAYQMAGLVSCGQLCIYPESRHMAMYDRTAQMIHDLASFYAFVKTFSVGNL